MAIRNDLLSSTAKGRINIKLNPGNNNQDNLVLLDQKTHKQLHYKINFMNNPKERFFGKNINLRGEVL